MSANCIFVVRNAKQIDRLRCVLVNLAKAKACGIGFEPMNGLLATQSIGLNLSDFVFEVCDDFVSNVAELLLSYEGYIVNGRKSPLSLLQRMEILQDIALTCQPYGEKLEIYLGDNNPYLPDYTVCRLAYTDVANALFKEYQKDSVTPFIPCIHLIVEKQQEHLF